MKMEEMLQLIEAVSASELVEFKYEENGTKLSLKKAQQKEQILQVGNAVPVAEIRETEQQTEAAPQTEEEKVIVSPLVGTFYAAPSEDAESFVKVGDRVEAGQVVGIVEAMKLMNEIESECAGTVAEILVENGESVEYGQPMFRITV